MDLAAKIMECQTIAALTALENLYVFTEREQEMLLERKVEIVCRVAEWRIENERLGLVADLTDTWTPEQREMFLLDWNNDEPLLEMMANEDFIRAFEDNIHQDEPLLQVGCGKKRSIDEANDGSGTSDEVSGNNFFTMTDVKQVKVKKFNTTGVDYTVQFTDTFAHLEVSEFHDRLHEIFENLLNAITKDITKHDQVRFVLRSPQLEYPISLLFLPLSRLTTERVVAEIERVIQSNHEFRLNDTVQVNLIHVKMPNGGTGTKRSEIKLEKHLAKKGSIIRIQNKDEICLARALVVSMAKIENGGQYKSIVDHRRPLQTRLAYDLHEKAGGSCRSLWSG